MSLFPFNSNTRMGPVFNSNLAYTDETDLWCLCGKLAMNSGRFNTEGKLAQYQFRESLDMKPVTRFHCPSQAYMHVS
jgi:hypothetical protein